MRIEDGVKLDFDDVLIKPKRSAISSRADVELNRKFLINRKGVYCKTWEGVPIIAANMYGTGTMNMAKSLAKYDMVTALHKHYTIEQLKEFFYETGASDGICQNRVFITVGTNDNDIEKIKQLSREIVLYMVCVDVANGYTESFLDKIKRIREYCPHAILMAGNVVSYEMTEALILGGVDIVKIGIGPGSCCETRLKTGVGYPQLSAIEECKDAAHGLGGLVCADGGCKIPADICKAFGVGADFVMLGGMLAGTDECEGEWTYQNVREGRFSTTTNKKVALKFYGMSSKEAQEKHNGGLKNYRASEGRSVDIPYKGPVENVINDVLGGLRSSCSYIGAEKLKDFSKCCTFVRVNNTHNRVFENMSN